MSNHDWEIVPLDHYALAGPREPGELGAELLVQARPSGRLQDHFRFVVDGTTFLTAEIPSCKLFLSDMLPSVIVKIQLRPREIGIRQNLTTSEWVDVIDKLKSKDFLLAEEAEGDDENANWDFITILEAAADKAEVSASIRWAIAATQDGTLILELQCLPATAATLNSIPALKG
jgi:hypothetical protein